LLAGCAQLGQQLHDIQQLGAQLATEFQQPIGVNLANGGTLTLSMPMPDSAHDKMTAESRSQVALRVARFARAHYAHPASLLRINVVWVSQSSYGVVHVSRTYAGGSWSPRELGPDTGAPPSVDTAVTPAHPAN